MKNSIYANIPKNIPNEIFEDLLKDKNIRIERILSKGHTSPKSGWYDQKEHEWVLLIKGEAILDFEIEKIHLKEGDYINIPAHKKHRVSWTKPEDETIWLTVKYGG